MSTTNIICICVFAVAVISIATIKIYKTYKNKNKKFNLSEFISTYGDQIIAILKDVVKLLKVSESEYPTKEDYEKAIIELTIEEIKQNYDELNIDVSILNLIDSKTLATIICDILHGNAINIFSVLDASVIDEHKNLYDESVVAAISAK